MLTENTPSKPLSNARLIVVMGVSGSGKSTVAKQIATIFQYHFLDADDFHSAESRALMSQGIPLTDAHRAPWVAAIKKQLEENALQQIHTILAFSGLRRQHRDQLRSAGLNTLVIYLNGDKSTIASRMQKRKNHFMPSSLLDSQLKSMEDPTQEEGVSEIDIANDLSQVITQATEIIARHFRNS